MKGAIRTTRFRGAPGEEPPDAGDVLAACSHSTGMVTGTRYVVVSARPTRGHPAGSGRVTLAMARDDTAEPAEGSRLITFFWDRR